MLSLPNQGLLVGCKTEPMHLLRLWKSISSATWLYPSLTISWERWMPVFPDSLSPHQNFYLWSRQCCAVKRSTPQLQWRCTKLYKAFTWADRPGSWALETEMGGEVIGVNIKLLCPCSQAMWPSAVPQHCAAAETGPHSVGHIMWMWAFGKHTEN